MKIFIDSSFWIALTVRTDTLHSQSVKLFTNEIIRRSSFSTSDYVLDETLTRLKRKVGASAANKFYELIKEKESKRILRIYRVTKALFHESYKIFQNHPSPLSFSFTDATIIGIMKRYALEYILTFDSDFRKLGVKICTNTL